MANGAISYVPKPSRAASLDGVNYLLLLEDDNLIGVNPDAELGDLTGWKLPVSVAVISTDHYSGTYCFEFGATSSLYSDQHFDLIRGQRYKIFFAGKKTSTSNSLTIIVGDENQLAPPAFPVTFHLTTSWALYSYNFIADRDYFNCDLRISSYGAAVIDDILLVPAPLDMGLDSFSLDFLFQPFTQANARVIARKGAADATGAGWCLYYSGTTYKYGLNISDGAVAISTYFSPTISQIQDQACHWGRLLIDRTAGLARMFVNDVAKGIIDYFRPSPATSLPATP